MQKSIEYSSSIAVVKNTDTVVVKKAHSIAAPEYWYSNSEGNYRSSRR